MKSISTLLLCSLVLLTTSCSKDFLRKYDRRIVGAWRITDVDRFGLGGNLDNLPFASGNFTFFDDGSLTYIDETNTRFTGSWDIIKRDIDDETLHSLKITAVDYTGNQARFEFYDDIQFVGDNHFKARRVSGFHTYVTSFRR
ncbi:MAG TPA: hypothetical protein VGC95_11905 [Chitinophagaceae bacterium]